MRSRFVAAAPLAVAAALLVAGGSQARGPSLQAVYTQTNSAAGNAVQVLARSDDGTLTPAGSYATGGLGTSAGLGSQGAVALSDNGRVLLAVDAGSNDIASFRVDRRTGGLTLVGRVPCGAASSDELAAFTHPAGSASSADCRPPISLT